MSVDDKSSLCILPVSFSVMCVLCSVSISVVVLLTKNMAYVLNRLLNQLGQVVAIRAVKQSIGDGLDGGEIEDTKKRSPTVCLQKRI